MSWFRTLLLPLVVGSVLLLAGAIGQQPARTPQPANKPGPSTPTNPDAKNAPPKADPRAVALLAEAVKSVDPKKLEWVETNLWQQGNLQGMTFQVDGKYVAGPGHRLHLAMQTHVGDTTGNLEVISDGTTMWEIRQVGHNDKIIAKKMLNKVLEALNSPNVLAQIREEFFKAESFTGVASVLETIQQRMTPIQHEQVDWNGRQMIRIRAIWSADSLKSFPNADRQWIPYMPDQCRLYLLRLGNGTLWPYRLEWWGPAPPIVGETLLLQMEYRHPKVNQELPAERLASEFTFDPGTAEVRDFTQDAANFYRSRSQQLAQQAKPK
jgi:hypothetical protein